MLKGVLDWFKRELQLTKEYYQAEANKNDNPPYSVPELQSVLDDESKTLEEKNAAYLAIRDEEERRLNEAYDFNSIRGINSIPVPCREVNGNSSTGRVEYYLRGQCFAKHMNAGNIDLAIACLKKAQELMYISDMIWKRNDFMRLVNYLHKAGRHNEADIELKRIDDFFEKQDIHLERNLRELSSAENLEIDLVEVYTYSPYCGECAKYINRIYSVSGKDKRFPALPKGFSKKGPGHNFACLNLGPFTYGVSEPTFKCKNIIEYSNRPFVDERTQEEIERYNNWLFMMEEEEAKRKRTEQCRLEYYWLQEKLPQLCPKSLSGYVRMKNANTKNYQKIVAEAKRLGKQLS